MIEQITIVLLIIVSIMMVLALVGVGIIIHNIKDKPVKPITAEEIDYHGADRLGGTDNEEDE